MTRKGVALPVLGLVAVFAGGLARRRALSSWQGNVDPLAGRPVRFPSGRQQMVELPDGARISTITAGDGPMIVCVHGVTASRRDWGPMAPYLIEAGFQVIAVEQRGHGDSTLGTAGFGSTQLGDDLAVVLAALDVRGATLVGQSMGGMAVMTMALNHQLLLAERVDSMSLIATAGSMSSTLQSVGLAFAGVGIPERTPTEPMRLAARMVFGARPSLHMIDEVLEMFHECPEPVRAEAMAALRDHDVLARLPQLDTPTLVVGGTRDRLIRPAQIRELAQAIPHSKVHLFDDAGHMLIWERPREMARLISDFARESG